MLSKAISFLTSVLSGQADPDVVARRVQQCYAPCAQLRRTGVGDYCGACGCGITPQAELHTKLRYRYLVCPLKKPGFSNGPAN